MRLKGIFAFKSSIGFNAAMSKTFAVIGDPIDHSLSPNIHSAAFRHLGMNDCTYIAYRIPRGELAQGIESLQKIRVYGFNVTVPHKVEMMRYLSKTDESCSLVGATNTVKRLDDGTLKGYNTDVDGFAIPLRERSVDLAGARAILLGAGGAARAVVAAMARDRVSHLTIANRTKQSADTLAEIAKSSGIPDVQSIHLEDADSAAVSCNIIVNSTSIGLPSNPEKVIPISAESIDSGDIIYDIVYMPMNTDLIKKGKDRGATCIMGYEMLLSQAARSFEIWHEGKKAPRDAMKRALLGVGPTGI